jgi:hypothetical protein
MFVLSLNEGKSTIRFSDPLVDVIIADADPRGLATFLRLLSGKPVKIHTISPPSLALGVMKLKTLSDLKRDVTDPKLINVPSIEARSRFSSVFSSQGHSYSIRSLGLDRASRMKMTM